MSLDILTNKKLMEFINRSHMSHGNKQTSYYVISQKGNNKEQKILVLTSGQNMMMIAIEDHNNYYLHYKQNTRWSQKNLIAHGYVT